MKALPLLHPYGSLSVPVRISIAKNQVTILSSYLMKLQKFVKEIFLKKGKIVEITKEVML